MPVKALLLRALCVFFLLYCVFLFFWQSAHVARYTARQKLHHTPATLIGTGMSKWPLLPSRSQRHVPPVPSHSTSPPPSCASCESVVDISKVATSSRWILFKSPFYVCDAPRVQWTVDDFFPSKHFLTCAEVPAAIATATAPRSGSALLRSRTGPQARGSVAVMRMDPWLLPVIPSNQSSDDPQSLVFAVNRSVCNSAAFVKAPRCESTSPGPMQFTPAVLRSSVDPQVSLLPTSIFDASAELVFARCSSVRTPGVADRSNVALDAVLRPLPKRTVLRRATEASAAAQQRNKGNKGVPVSPYAKPTIVQLVIDSLSSPHFDRVMPKSAAYLRDLGACQSAALSPKQPCSLHSQEHSTRSLDPQYQALRYNSHLLAGDNTNPNSAAMLGGIRPPGTFRKHSSPSGVVSVHPKASNDPKRRLADASNEAPSPREQHPWDLPPRATRPWVFEIAREQGYATAIVDDSSDPLFDGLRGRPKSLSPEWADHYTGSFARCAAAVASGINDGFKDRRCLGSRSLIQHTLDYARAFLFAAPKRLQTSQTFHSTIETLPCAEFSVPSAGGMNDSGLREGNGLLLYPPWIPRLLYAHLLDGHEETGTVFQFMDDDLHAFMRDVVTQHQTLAKRGESCGFPVPPLVFFVMGDHGMRFGAYRGVEGGALEYRLPLLSVILSNSFLNAHPSAELTRRITLRSQGMVTKYDLYLTLSNLLQGTIDGIGGVNSADRYSLSDIDGIVAVDLFGPSSLLWREFRTCQSAGVAASQCPCGLNFQSNLEVEDSHESSSDLSVYNPHSSLEIANEVIRYLNRMLVYPDSPCSRLSLSSVRQFARVLLHVDQAGRASYSHVLVFKTISHPAKVVSKWEVILTLDFTMDEFLGKSRDEKFTWFVENQPAILRVSSFTLRDRSICEPWAKKHGVNALLCVCGS